MFPAGSVVSDVGGQLPAGFVPSAYMDPLDTDAVTKFYAAGPQFRPVSGTLAQPAVTYWVPDPSQPASNPYFQFVLTGLGAGSPFAQLLGKRLG